MLAQLAGSLSKRTLPVKEDLNAPFTSNQLDFGSGNGDGRRDSRTPTTSLPNTSSRSIVCELTCLLQSQVELREVVGIPLHIRADSRIISNSINVKPLLCHATQIPKMGCRTLFDSIVIDSFMSSPSLLSFPQSTSVCSDLSHLHYFTQLPEQTDLRFPFIRPLTLSSCPYLTSTLKTKVISKQRLIANYNNQSD